MLLGPLYIATCGGGLRAGHQPSLCMLGWAFAGLIVLPIAGLLAGARARGGLGGRVVKMPSGWPRPLAPSVRRP
jgi:hypothetical protein